MKQPEIDIIKTRYRAQLENFNLNCQAMIDYSKSACRGAFIINGAAIIPIVYSKVDYFYPSAILFGYGALSAVVASCLSYITQWLITSASNENFIIYPFRTLPYRPESEKELNNISWHKKLICWARCAAMGSIVVSLCLFFYGLWRAQNLMPLHV